MAALSASAHASLHAKQMQLANSRNKMRAPFSSSDPHVGVRSYFHTTAPRGRASLTTDYFWGSSVSLALLFLTCSPHHRSLTVTIKASSCRRAAFARSCNRCFCPLQRNQSSGVRTLSSSLSLLWIVFVVYCKRYDRIRVSAPPQPVRASVLFCSWWQ